MAEELNALRDKIDAVDKQLIDLLAARLAHRWGKWGVKTGTACPSAPDREASILARRRARPRHWGARGPRRGRAAG